MLITLRYMFHNQVVNYDEQNTGGGFSKRGLGENIMCDHIYLHVHCILELHCMSVIFPSLAD